MPCRLGSITATTATSSSRTPIFPESAIFRAFSISAPELFESTQTYAEGILKGACNRFLKTGFCPYGDSCKYVHPKNIRGPNSQLPPENKQAAMILGSQLAAGALSQGDVVTNIMGIAWGNLPPSLKPPPEGGYPPLPFLDWG
ncbi:zinc finger CCCH domain-containing protein 3 isoform X2 [Punica granatum]|uniref:Zinc finger CCCH domain-containing protein 3 isoform X2 n=1 Tax=Punica granatum TaxID=22663 RepID=A0A6P8CYJ6_PUNGR|nr:zinc finger CCCH domain-containing protein 3 isoform X2 [Punica granatum]